MLARDYDTQVKELSVKEKLLDQHKKIFKNNPLIIKNPRDGEAYTIEAFYAQVLVETQDSFYIKTYEEQPSIQLKPGGSYMWQDIEEDKNMVPGDAFLVTMFFSKNNGKNKTLHTFPLNEKGTLFSPNFNYNQNE